MSDRRHFVYRAWDAADRPLYVGCSGNLKQRRANHRATSEWFQYAVRTDLIGPFERQVALEREQEQILALRPIFNALPEHALMNRRRSRRHDELRDQMLAQVGLVTKEQVLDALIAESPVLQPIWQAIEAIVDVEFDMRCYHLGRAKFYRALIESETAA